MKTTLNELIERYMSGHVSHLETLEQLRILPSKTVYNLSSDECNELGRFITQSTQGSQRADAWGAVARVSSFEQMKEVHRYVSDWSLKQLRYCAQIESLFES